MTQRMKRLHKRINLTQKPFAKPRLALLCIALLCTGLLSACSSTPEALKDPTNARVEMRQILKKSDQAQYKRQNAYIEKRPWKSQELSLGPVLATFAIEKRYRAPESGSKAIIVKLFEADRKRFESFVVSQSRTQIAIMAEDEIIAIVNAIGISPPEPVIMVQGHEFSQAWLNRTMGLLAPTPGERSHAKQIVLPKES